MEMEKKSSLELSKVLVNFMSKEQEHEKTGFKVLYKFEILSLMIF